jgi:hypothetical protein
VQVMFLYDRPLGNVLVQFLQFLSLKRGNSTAAGHAFLISKLFGHECHLKRLEIGRPARQSTPCVYVAWTGSASVCGGEAGVLK